MACKPSAASAAERPTQSERSILQTGYSRQTLRYRSVSRGRDDVANGYLTDNARVTVHARQRADDGRDCEDKPDGEAPRPRSKRSAYDSCDDPRRQNGEQLGRIHRRRDRKQPRRHAGRRPRPRGERRRKKSGQITAWRSLHAPNKSHPELSGLNAASQALQRLEAYRGAARSSGRRHERVLRTGAAADPQDRGGRRVDFRVLTKALRRAVSGISNRWHHRRESQHRL